MAMPGMAIGGEIAKALKLPPETNFIRIDIGLDEAVEVMCRYYPNTDTMDQCQALIQKFHLTAVGDPENAEDEVFRTEDRKAREFTRLVREFERKQDCEQIIAAVLHQLRDRIDVTQDTVAQILKEVMPAHDEAEEDIEHSDA